MFLWSWGVVTLWLEKLVRVTLQALQEYRKKKEKKDPHNVNMLFAGPWLRTGAPVLHYSIIQWSIKRPWRLTEPLTLTVESISHTSSAVSPGGRTELGKRGRWGSGSEPRRAVAQIWGWTEDGATPARSTLGSDSLDTETQEEANQLQLKAHIVNT